MIVQNNSGVAACYLTMNQTRKLLSITNRPVNRTTVWRYVKRGALTAFKREDTPHRVYFSRTEVDKCWEQRYKRVWGNPL